MKIFIRAYLRASTDEQDAQRARGMLDRFVAERDMVICNYYTENQSGAHLNRPELFRLLADSRPRDVLLVEDVDRLSRLTASEWDKLKRLIREREVRVVAVNVPTTWQHLSPAHSEFDARMFSAINDMLLDMLAAMARRDYEQRRERQTQGIAKAKVAGKYRGRQVDQARYDAINRLLASGSSWTMVQRTVSCSRSTISRAIQHAATAMALPRPATSRNAITLVIWLAVENGSKFTRGKKRVREEINDMLTSSFAGRSLNDTETRVVMHFTDEADLKEQIDDLLTEVHNRADLHNCMVTDFSVKDEATGRYWCDHEGGWK